MRPALTVIAGPTASGKTRVAIELAERRGAEIISADSQQVYRYFDIGTAKPTAAELARVPHHLLSVVEPNDTFSAARFQALADAAIEEIASRQKPIVVVGGTGLYLRILLRGVAAAPGADPALRARLEAQAAQEGREAMHARLAQIDPATAAVVQPADLVRIIRALEIHELTGRPASEFRSEHRFEEQRYPYELYVLSPERSVLYESIDRRTVAMFDAGLLEEVERMVSLGFREAAPMRSVGYAQALAVIEGRMSRAEAIRDTAQKTRHYAKRQLTWFRKEPRAQWISAPFAQLIH